MTYTIRTKYEGQGKDVVGRTFATEHEAKTLLKRHGWKRLPYSESWTKEGPTRMIGQISVSVSEYVYIGEDEE